ncbi:flagellar motor protein MotD [endosymbiont of unidentified scaly snail isolate Monju]|uniref:flagellar motor protein MotD n=1 Tax=endosymbiont of unidentified scaly snail isolate Monju TaxID=1248727 RepID=UPI000389211C|nr:flagellar motor protein MotD [endosymbiont of unidentified scaly snail isolate Monju]BAN69594.1 chemotaxis protein MotB [endosymbiont of unidentified scaly snail isolate Monju]
MRRLPPRRRRRQAESENHERWLVSYADFITLLFAFFVVMYSISSVNEGKYKVLSKALGTVFGVEQPSVQTPDAAVDAVLSQPVAVPSDPSRERLRREAMRALQKAASQQRVYDELAISLQEWTDRGLVDIRMNGDRIEVDMKARLLFSSGDARLSADAMNALGQVARSLVAIPNPIQVEGHTDNVPIANAVYRSNWELSAARAASVVQFLQSQGVDPRRLAAVGRGEYHPIADNSSEEGRARNRRVTLLILGQEQEIFDPGQIVPWAEGPALEPETESP